MDKCVDGRRKLINRLLSYGLGIVILALGITLNTKTGLGVSALVSIAYTVANAWNLNFALMTFLLYTCFALIEVGLKWGFLPQLRKVLWKDLLQIPFFLSVQPAFECVWRYYSSSRTCWSTDCDACVGNCVYGNRCSDDRRYALDPEPGRWSGSDTWNGDEKRNGTWKKSVGLQLCGNFSCDWFGGTWTFDWNWHWNNCSNDRCWQSSGIV